MRIYAEMGIRYTVIFNPHHGRRDKRDPLEVYELKDKQYHRLPGDPVWLEGVGLGIGVERREEGKWERDWLYWYNREGERYLTSEELIEQERILKVQEQLRAEQERLLKEAATQQAEQESIRAEQERIRADQERIRADQERMRAEREELLKQQAHQRAEEECLRAEQERLRADRLAARLKELGLDPDDVE
jgi:hypothetical protein